MAKIIFNNKLANQIQTKYHIRNSTKPFSSWLVEPVTLKERKYYVYIEQSTNFAIVASFLDKNKFTEALSYTLSNLPFITSLQIDKLSNILFSPSYSYEKNASNDFLPNYQKILNTLPPHELNEIKALSKDDEILEAILLSIHLNQITAIDNISISTILSLKLNKELPLSAKKPKSNVKYVDLQANYTDPWTWEKVENLTPSSIPAKQLRENNLKIINQFEHSSYFKPNYKTYNVFSALEAFLNSYLFNHRIRPVTTNLADPINFIELNIRMHENVSPEVEYALFDLFISFYNFLSHAGTIRKADAKKVTKLLQETYKEYNDENIDELRQVSALKDNKKVTTRPKNQDQTYEIKVKLRDFKPSTWRTFKISGAASVATLQKVVITMFNGLLLGHMYDLYDKKTQTTYELPEFQDEDVVPTIDATKVKLSEFSLNQKLIVTYDFGDNWEFEVVIKKVLDEKPPKHPTILSGKGFGIIEDIGGVGRLTDYYNSKFSQEEKNWYGDFNLDEFDIDEMNEELAQFK